MAKKRVLCRVGWHRWVRKSNPDGGGYLGCKYCTKENTHVSGASAGGTMTGF